MPDSRLEDQLRSALRTEAETDPVTITAAELERRLRARRRARDGRRLSFLAAGVAALAIGGLVAASNGWLRLPAVGAIPGETPTPTEGVPSTGPTIAPSAAPSEHALPTNGIEPRAPIGSPGDAIIVRPIVDPTAGAQVFEVQRSPSEDDMETIATYSGIIGANVSTDPPPRVSSDGYLAVPWVGMPGLDRSRGVAIYDLHDIGRDPHLLPDLGSTGIAWVWDGRLALFDPLVVTVVEPYGAGRRTVPIPPGVVIVAAGLAADEIWAADGSGFEASSTDVSVGTSQAGILRLDGSFVTQTPPETATQIGPERRWDAAARQLAVTCASMDDQGVGHDCGPTVLDPDGTATRWATVPDDERIVDVVWDATRQAAWMLVDRLDADRRPLALDLRHGDDGGFETVSSLSTAGVVDAFDPRIVGISIDDGRFAIQLTEGGLVLLYPEIGEWIPASGTFAGWADTSGTGG